jgi:hypothetical protein
VAASLAPFLMGITWYNAPYAASDPHVVAPLTTGCVAFVAFVLYEWKGRNDGLFHHRLFSGGPNYALALIGIFVEGLVGYAGFVIYWPQEVQIIFGASAFGTGIRFSAFWWIVLGTSADPYAVAADLFDSPRGAWRVDFATLQGTGSRQMAGIRWFLGRPSIIAKHFLRWLSYSVGRIGRSNGVQLPERFSQTGPVVLEC